MQTLTLHIPNSTLAAGDACRVYGNVGDDGEALASVDLVNALSGAKALPVFPKGSDPDADERTFVPKPLYFGRYSFVVRTEDERGNVTADADREFEVFVNSGPERARDVRHSSTSGGRPVFTFTPPGQMG
jgi:hypothetical protein